MKYALYMHGGSGNHGCEALVRTVSSLVPDNCQISVFSKRIIEDEKYIQDHTFSIVSSGIIPAKTSLSGLISAIRMKFFKQKLAYVKPAYKSLLKYCDKNTVAISIGGDNYCYDGMPEVLAKLNTEIKKRGAKTVLLGCSVEPELLRDEAVKADMENYSLITVRESITYKAMKEAGIKTNVQLIPDSAFILPVEKHELPSGFMIGNTIGINISPLVKSLEKSNGILLQSYKNMIEYVLKETNMTIALIPHVIWASNNDISVLKELYEIYKGSGRMVLVEDRNAVKLKYVISQCRFLIAARTHASIAAYSTCVPTLVVGYSVKSLGIAKDLFGTHQNYVLPMDDIQNGDELVSSVKWLMENEVAVRNHLQSTIPQYIQPLSEMSLILNSVGR